MFLLLNKIYDVFRDQLAVSCLIPWHLSSLKIMCAWEQLCRLGWIGKSSLIQQNFRTNFKNWGFEYCKFLKAYAEENSSILSYFPRSSSWLTKNQVVGLLNMNISAENVDRRIIFLSKSLRNMNIVHIFIMLINFFVSLWKPNIIEK